MGKYQLLPPLSEADYAALKADIKKRGVIVAVEYDETGEIIDGYHRVKICEELSITDFPKNVRSYQDEPAKRSQARKLNLLRRHLDAKTKRELIEAELKDNPDRSDRQVAAQLGVSDKTVARARRKSEGRAEIPHTKKRTDRTGRKQPATKPKKSQVTKAAAQPPKPKTSVVDTPADPIIERCPDCATPEEEWQRSLTSLASDAISLPAFWSRQFGDDWKHFTVTSELVALAQQAADTWSKLASELGARRRNDR